MYEQQDADCSSLQQPKASLQTQGFSKLLYFSDESAVYFHS